jgi:Bax inhibitor 1
MNQFSTTTDFSSLNLDKVFTLNNYSTDVKKHLVNVYLSLLACLICTAFGVYATLYFQFQLGSTLTFLGSLGMMFWIQMDSKKEEFQRRVAMLCGFGFLQGLSIAPLIALAIYIDPAIVMTAVIGTVTVFACFSAAAMTAQRRSWLFLGGFLSSATSLLLVLGLANYFFNSVNIYGLQLYGGLLLFSGYVIFDTQLILEKAENGSRDAVGHALHLFLDFIAILVRILVILIKNAEKKDNKKKNNRR